MVTPRCVYHVFKIFHSGQLENHYCNGKEYEEILQSLLNFIFTENLDTAYLVLVSDTHGVRFTKRYTISPRHSTPRQKCQIPRRRHFISSWHDIIQYNNGQCTIQSQIMVSHSNHLRSPLWYSSQQSYSTLFLHIRHFIQTQA